MQKIVIENFMAIPYAEIEVNKVLVLIGEQASGKSTIAKLIYFFKSLRDELFNQVYQDSTRGDFDIDRDFAPTIRNKFYDFFGSDHFDFSITYYYKIFEYIKIAPNSNSRSISVKFDIDTTTNKFEQRATQLKRELQKNRVNTEDSVVNMLAEQNEAMYASTLSSLVNDMFYCLHNSSLYVIAGRNATVSYSDIFEKYFFANLQRKIEENKGNSSIQKEQTIDEVLMLKFVERTDRIKSFFKKYGDFGSLIDFYANSKRDIDKNNFISIYETITKILKGDYKIDNQGEKIMLPNENKSVHLNNASSGQQESIRILQDIFLSLIEQQKVFRIIEEPEAHLFPEAQKLMIELLAILANADDDNQVIITTHSPYVLTVFNNLLFANRVIEKNPDAREEVSKLIDSQSIIKANDFAAYSLNPSQADEKGEGYCVNLVNERTQVIDQNYLDTVSEELSNDFRTLYDLHTKSFARR